MLQKPTGHCVTSLVIGHGLLLFRLEDVGLLFETRDHSFDGGLKMFVYYTLGQFTGGDEGRLVADVGHIGTAKAGREGRQFAGQGGFIQVRFEIVQMDFEDGGATLK